MDLKKFFIGTLVGGILSFLLGWLIYGVLLMKYMRSNAGEIGHVTDRAEPIMLYLVVGNLFYGAFITYVLLKANVKSVVGGFITGAVLGFLITAAVDCMMYALTRVTSKHAMLADVIAATIMVGIIGAAVALVTGGKKDS